MWLFVFALLVIVVVSISVIRWPNASLIVFGLILLVFLASCASTPERQAKKELNKYCAKQGSVLGDMRCAKPKPPPDTKDMVKYCVYRGPIKREEDCIWITREEAQRILRQIQRGY